MRDDLDEIKFGEMEFHTEYNGKNYIISTKGGAFFGMATVKNGTCTNWETVYSKADFTYLVEDEDEYIPYEAADALDINFAFITNVLDNRMWQYLNAEVVEKKVQKVA